MDIQSIISQYGIIAYALIIFFGGRWGLKFITVFKETKHNFLLFATLWGIIWIAIEVINGKFEFMDATKYILTYAVVTSCYEMFSDLFPFLKPKDTDKKDV